MSEFLRSVFTGIGQGSIYALLALGFVIIYKSTRVISFAIPSFMLAGAVVVSYLVGPLGFLLAVAVGVIAVSMLALGVERTVVRPMVGRPVFVVAIITLGIDIVIRVILGPFIGQEVRQVGDPWGFNRTTLLGISVEQRHIAMFLTALVVVGLLFAFFRFTRFGLAMRAAAFDQETALTQGVSVGSVFAMSWAFAGALAAIAGVALSTGAGFNTLLWIAALKALPAIILGGLDSLGGAVVGGLTIGVVEILTRTYQADIAPWLGNNFAFVVPYAVMLLVLLVKPYGLFGTPEVERV